jgi:hypothetical protein
MKKGRDCGPVGQIRLFVRIDAAFHPLRWGAAMAHYDSSEFSELSPVDAMLALDVTTDGQHASLTLHLENNNAVCLSMAAPVAMRIWAALDQARRDSG